MHAGPLVRGREVLPGRLGEPRHQVVRVQHRGLGRLLQPVGAEREDVGVGAHEDAEVALEPAQAADRLRAVVVEVERRAGAVAGLAPDHLGAGQVGLDPLRDGDRAGARAAASVRLRERLVQVEVDDVEAHVAGPGVAHHRVQVRAVVVERRAHVVDDVRDLLDRGVEQPERVRVGQHQAGDVVAGLRLEVVDVDAALVVRPDLDHLVARHRHRRRVGAVGGVGGQDLGPRLAAVGVVGTGEQDARQLAVGPGARLERDVRQAGDLRQRGLQLPHQPQRALGAARVLERMQAGVPRQRGDPLVQLRVVLHRARPERVEAGVEVEVALREPVEVADDLRLGDLRQLRRLGAAEAVGQQAVALGHVERGRDERAPAGL